jgi:transcriptional regulator with GAF, ATPase, and Fis domain
MVSRDEITMLEALGRQLSVVVQNAAAFTEIDTLNRDLGRQRREILALKDRLEAENVYLREEIHQVARHGEIVGESESMRQVLEQVARVGPTDATVFIYGESGTGKELVARAIHASSDRRDRPMVTINCAAIPEGLLESELFGHERGAFTGAVARQPGRFELADGGTLFFDEVGDMPLSLQAKLLRALQEREITPVGATRSRRVDVRVISATHRDLEQRVAEGSFREDLLYRLNVVPLRLPPLRERAEDIPLLAEYFATELARRTGKAVTGISRRAMDRLIAYPWPGNVRELANVMERAVVLSGSTVLDEEITLPRVRGEHVGGGPGKQEGQGDVGTNGIAGDGGAGDGGAGGGRPQAVPLSPFHDAVREFKRDYLARAIEQADGNRAEAARRLALQRTYLYRLERQLGLKD